ncbi:outer membrane protein assembly factor BamB family protein [Kitasatospora sp. NBC_00458]|uniref:outer membrane protein assembly factor BamB family protein n=1 Tax=Kitasatospora sp. NBC_00458 TaxID=2903568 RepID=UPI002E195E52
MAQDPLGDGRPQQWQAQQVPQEWPAGYGEHAGQAWPGEQGYGAGDGTAYPDRGYGETAYGQGGHQDGTYGRHDQYNQYNQYVQGDQYVQGQYVQGEEYGQADPYVRYDQGTQYQPHQQYADYGQQQYAPYAVPQQPVGEELYAPAGAEYSADGYVHLEPEPEPEPLPAPEPEAEAETSVRTAGPAAGPAAGPRARAGLAARARAATDAAAEHTPSRRALAVRTGAGVAALGVLIAAGLTVGSDGGGRGSAGAAAGGEPGFTVAHTRMWSAQSVPVTQAAQPGGDDTLVGSWLLADTVVRADATGVHAYDLAAGRPTWSVEPPAAGAVPCGLSPGVNEAGVGAVLFRPQADPKSPCALVAAVDTKAGKTAWTKTLSEVKGLYTARIGVTEDKVIAVGDDHVVAWESADGKDVWQYTGQGKFCTLSGGVAGRTVLVASSCADSTPVDQAVALNTVDGTVAWWRGLNNRPKTATVLSAEPAVVLTTGEKPEDDRVFAWGAGGDPTAEIPVTVDEGRLEVAHGAFSATPGVYFQDRTMVTTVAPAANGGGPASVVGYDLDSGKQRWKTVTSEKGEARAVGVDGGALVLAFDERLEQPAHLSRFALDGGRETVGGNFPQGTGSLLISGRVLIGGGRVVAVPEHSTNFGTATGYQAKG